MQCRELCSHAAAMQWPPCSSSCCSSSMHADSCMPVHACRFIQSCSSSSSSMHAYMQIENASCKLQAASCNERSRVRIFKICVHYDAATTVHVVQNRGCVHYTRSLEGCSGPSCPKFSAAALAMQWPSRSSHAVQGTVQPCSSHAVAAMQQQLLQQQHACRFMHAGSCMPVYPVMQQQQQQHACIHAN